MYQRIRDLREDRDLTQKNMGEILNCSQRIYSNYECGDVDIPTHILINDFCRISIHLQVISDCFAFHITKWGLFRSIFSHASFGLDDSLDFF